MTVIQFIIACGLASLLYGLFAGRSIMAAPSGSEKMRNIAAAIQEGARAYLNRQYMTIGMVGIVIGVLISVKLGWYVGVGYAIGASLSGIAGYIGMNISVRANVRTAEAAKSGLQPALNIAFKSGAVTGMLVVGLGLLGISIYYTWLQEQGIDTRHIVEALVALSFGASLISIFARHGRLHQRALSLGFPADFDWADI